MLINDPMHGEKFVRARGLRIANHEPVRIGAVSQVLIVTF